MIVEQMQLKLLDQSYAISVHYPDLPATREVGTSAGVLLRNRTNKSEVLTVTAIWYADFPARLANLKLGHGAAPVSLAVLKTFDSCCASGGLLLSHCTCFD